MGEGRTFNVPETRGLISLCRQLRSQLDARATLLLDFDGALVAADQAESAGYLAAVVALLHAPDGSEDARPGARDDGASGTTLPLPGGGLVHVASASRGLIVAVVLGAQPEAIHLQRTMRHASAGIQQFIHIVEKLRRPAPPPLTDKPN
jgi:hypothetical protein